MSYHGQTDQAPRVVAGGRGTVAEQILEIAFANGIKVCLTSAPMEQTSGIA
ncbi:MAG: hypothetical protein HOD33_15045 [Acidiferrobacteraceae bacterium]|nr:hypothetical protein [Acidiferrobacteraceae bacterium]